MIFGLWLAAYLCLPDTIFGLSPIERSYLHAWGCSVFGLVAGCLIGFITEYYTSHSYSPV
jgi:inorganic pyrophosphatase